MKRIILFVLILASVLPVLGQQEAMFTHYAFNTLQVNPAYAGSREVTTLTALHRNQWAGFTGAPTTQTLSIHSPVFTNSLGLGLSVLHDQIGPIQNIGVYGDVTYRLRLSETTKLAFGIKGGGDFYQADLESLVIIDQQDGAFNNVSTKFLPNVGGGVYLSNPKWYVGLSAPKLLETAYQTGLNGSANKEVRHFWFIAGTVFDLSNAVKLKPTTFVKATAAAPLQADLTAMFIFNDKIEAGLMGRTGDALGVLLGYNFNNKFRLGYSFDWSFENKTSVDNNGSHEVMLRYDIFDANPKKIYSPRYF